MTRHGRYLIVGLTVLAAFWLAADSGQAGGGQKEAWMPILPKEIYKELVKREADKIQQILGGKVEEDGLRRAAFGATLIMACAKSVKEGSGEDIDGTYATAALLYKALRQKDGLENAKLLAANLVAGKTKGAAAPNIKDLGKPMDNRDLMDHFRPVAKGGDGMHPDLQNNIKFKGALNGIEEKIRYLDMKELSAAGIKKEAKELELLGYRTAVVGALTYLYAPPTKIGNKDPEDWRRFSIAMRDSGVALASAAAKADAAGVRKASSPLNSSCNQCHSGFRN
jgi:hypothetical protein